MAKKELTIPYSNEEFLRKLEHPVWLVYDARASLYRYFADKEWHDAAYTLLELGEELTMDILEKELFNLTAPAPYTLNINSLTDNRYILLGTKGVNVEFSFMTVDGNGGEVNESVDAYFTVNSAVGSTSYTKIYSAGQQASVNVDDALGLGTNTITILLRGRSTGATRTVVITYYVVLLEISSTFDISRSISPNTSFGVTYTVVGQADKTVEFYIDGVLTNTANVSSLEASATRTQIINNLDGRFASGKHSLQIRANMMAGDNLFYSNILYYEFVITGKEQAVIMLSCVFPPTSGIMVGTVPGLFGEQYVKYVLTWAYYNSNPLLQSATIQWKLYANGETTTIATRTADVVQAETDRMPDPIEFMPTEEGDYQLQAFVGNDEEPTEIYTIAVIKNTAGVVEAVEGLTMKLTGLGRSNDEPENTRKDWFDRGHKATFYNVPWNGACGWNSNALWLNNGATAIIDHKPFATELAPQSNNGLTFEIEFETFNVDSEDAILLKIGDNLSAHLYIMPNKAVLSSRMGTEIFTQYKSDEKVKLSFNIMPNSIDHTSEPCLMFIQNNGIRERAMNYNVADTFNIGVQADSDDFGKIHLGDPNAKAGIKIYSIRTYSNAITMYEEFYNYAIDSGENLIKILSRNDIYITGSHDISAEKCEAVVDTIYITGDVDVLAQTSSKTSISAAMSRRCPLDPTRNFDCELAQLSNAGQSTLGMPVPSMHVKLDKNNNITYDMDGNPIKKNYYAIRKGNIPEKKFRLQANYMDSSGCHNGSFLRMINKVFPKVQVDGKYVLRTPPLQYALEEYPSKMGVKFPYEIELTPDSMPCVVFWRKDEADLFRFLGQYVIMEEKKATRTCGLRSIYNTRYLDGTPDPFKLEASGGTRLWDNANCMQFEVLRNSHDLVMFKNYSSWEELREDGTYEREQAFEMIYPDPEDVIADGEDPLAYWDEFFLGFIKPITDTYNNHEAFASVWKEVLDPYFTAAYYCLMLRHGCVDNSVRNIEWTTFDGKHWLPKFWDVDIQFGLRNDGPLVFDPCIDRDSHDPLNPSTYAFAGRDSQGNSCWFWDALEANEEFMSLVATVDHALYLAGWRYDELVKMLDEEYCAAWAEEMYNESGDVKYTKEFLKGNNYLAMLLGSRTSHRHWWERTSFDFWDAKHVSGEYTAKVMYLRAGGAKTGLKLHFTAGQTTFFGWGLTSSIQETGRHVEKGENFDFEIKVAGELGVNDPINVFAANKIEKADFSEVARYLSSALEFVGCYDSVTGSILKYLSVGVPKTQMAQNIYNTQTNISFTGLLYMSRLEHFDIQGMKGLRSVDISKMASLNTFLAAGSGLVSFDPANGSNLQRLELPNTLQSFRADGCTLGNITWWDGPSQVTISPTLTFLRFTGMGRDLGTQRLVSSWLKAISSLDDLSNYQITFTTVNWENVDIEDILTLARIPKAQRTITGYIKCKTEYTTEQMNTMLAAFGDNIFTLENNLVFDCDSDNIVISASGSNCSVGTDGAIEILQGTEATLHAAGFPLISSNPVYLWYIVNDGDYNTGMEGAPNILFGLNTLHYKTGLIKTIECSDNDRVYDLHVERVGGGQGNGKIRVKARTYPTSAVISLVRSSSNVTRDESTGEYIITNTGNFIFNADHFPAGYSGRMTEENGGLFGLLGVTSDIAAQGDIVHTNGRTDFDEYCMLVKALPEEDVHMSIGYRSKWRNGLTLDSQQLLISIVSVIEGVLSQSQVTGNYALFTALDKAGVPHLELYSYNSLELKRATDSFNFNALLTSAGVSPTSLRNFISGDRDVLRYLTNITSFDLHDTGMTGLFDITLNTRCKSVNLEGTDCGIKFGEHELTY